MYDAYPETVGAEPKTTATTIAGDAMVNFMFSFIARRAGVVEQTPLETQLRTGAQYHVAVSAVSAL